MPDAAVLLPMPVLPATQELLVFAYGSLLWNPEFEATSEVAILHGWHRRFCIASPNYRGTPEQPGLVLGLDKGGMCEGVLFRIAPHHAPTAFEKLWAREMITGAYEWQMVTLETANGPQQAHTFVARTEGPTYCNMEPGEQMARTILTCCGRRGPNLDYLNNTVQHLRTLGIHDRGLEALFERVQRLQGAGCVPG